MSRGRIGYKFVSDDAYDGRLMSSQEAPDSWKGKSHIEQVRLAAREEHNTQLASRLPESVARLIGQSDHPVMMNRRDGNRAPQGIRRDADEYPVDFPGIARSQISQQLLWRAYDEVVPLEGCPIPQDAQRHPQG